jgi:hypothetical protein
MRGNLRLCGTPSRVSGHTRLVLIPLCALLLLVGSEGGIRVHAAHDASTNSLVTYERGVRTHGTPPRTMGSSDAQVPLEYLERWITVRTADGISVDLRAVSSVEHRTGLNRHIVSDAGAVGTDNGVIRAIYARDVFGQLMPAEDVLRLALLAQSAKKYSGTDIVPLMVLLPLDGLFDEQRYASNLVMYRVWAPTAIGIWGRKNVYEVPIVGLDAPIRRCLMYRHVIEDAVLQPLIGDDAGLDDRLLGFATDLVSRLVDPVVLDARQGFLDGTPLTAAQLGQLLMSVSQKLAGFHSDGDGHLSSYVKEIGHALTVLEVGVNITSDLYRWWLVHSMKIGGARARLDALARWSSALEGIDPELHQAIVNYQAEFENRLFPAWVSSLRKALADVVVPTLTRVLFTKVLAAAITALFPPAGAVAWAAVLVGEQFFDEAYEPAQLAVLAASLLRSLNAVNAWSALQAQLGGQTIDATDASDAAHLLSIVKYSDNIRLL